MSLDPRGINDVGALALAVRSGASAVAVTERAVARAAAAPGIFWSLVPEHALADAHTIDERVRRGEPVGGLAGVPVAIKDTFRVRGVARTLGLAAPFDAGDDDAELVRRLRDAGAIVIGTTAMDQLAWTMTGQAPGRPPCPNPAVDDALPGGSSGGAAAAVAAGIVPLAIGTDTAGSVRVPAAWCGVVGYKPALGRLPLAGCAPVAESYDTAGLVASSVRDCAVAARALGLDVRAPARGAARRRLGVPRETIDAGVAEFDQALDGLIAAGHDLTVLELDLSARGMGRILAAEFAATWRHRLECVDLAPDVTAGLAHGARVAATEYVEMRDALAQAERRARVVFDAVDALILPTTEMAAPPVDAPVTVADAARFTRAISAFGWPAITVPLRDGAAAHPRGLQIVTGPGEDAALLDLADELWDRPVISHNQPERRATTHEP